MSRRPNPYRPGFGMEPAYLAGRAEVLEAAAEALESAALDFVTPRPLILVGPRGLGKTVTIRRVADVALERFSWPSVHGEAVSGSPMLEPLSGRLEEMAGLLRQQPPRASRGRITGGKVAAGAMGISGEVEWARESAGQGQHEHIAARFDAALHDVMSAADERDAGLVLTIDELQNADRGELGILGAALQRMTHQNAPLVVVVAALPGVRRLLQDRARGPKPPTYLERAEWHHLGHLPAADARDALERPAREAGRPLTSGATDVLAELAGGYPFALQVAGKYAWRAAGDAASVTAAHAHQAESRIRRDLETSLFQSRWDGAAPEERRYLSTLAALDDSAARNADVAKRLGKRPNQTSYLQERLVHKGTLYPDESSGGLRFVTPGMGAWLRDNYPEGTQG
ncbi:ATP-binding protein [Demetria terragena]|uniref:ATP-binding protein n=1 Tax=Demetria terragena TaxID=63959 RepID=UPI0003A193A5|nr:ATP-binding protein [Demetria terragena]